MRESRTRKRLDEGQAVRICGLGHFIPAFIRHAAHFGYDCIWLDLEHRAMTERELQSLLALFHLFDIDCMLRPPTVEKTRLYRYLEDGATGLMIPHVSTPEQAAALVDAVKFPPLGNRGLDGAGLDSDFFLQGGPDYPDQANRETFLVVQVETPEAVANIESIAAIEGIDGLFVGPADLGLRLSHAGDGAPSLEEATERVAAAASATGKAWGRPVHTVEQLEDLAGQGAQLLAHGGDFGAILAALEQCSGNFDRICGSG